MDTNDQSRLRDLEAENVELKRRLESLSHEPLPKGELVVQEFLIDSQSYGIPLEWLREVVHAVLTEPLAGAHPVVVGRFLYGNEPHSLIDL